MLRYIYVFGSILLLLAMTSMASARDITRTIDVDGDFTENTLEWGDTSSGMQYQVRIFYVDDEIEFCGAFAYKGQNRYRPLTDKALQYAKLTMNNKTILRDFRFFRRASLTKPWVGQKADCVSTGVAAPANEPEFEIKFRKIKYRG